MDYEVYVAMWDERDKFADVDDEPRLGFDDYDDVEDDSEDD